MNSQEQHIIKAIDHYPKGIKQVTQGLCLQAYHKGQKVLDIQHGKTYEYYDLASLTKAIFTNTQVMHLVSKKKLDLNQRVRAILPWFAFNHTTVRQLLNHTSGYKNWFPFYQQLKDIKSLKDKKLYLQQTLSSQVKTSTSRAIYSDLDYLTLGFLLEEITGKSLLDQWRELNQRLKSNMHFNQVGKKISNLNKYAPTEKCPWRKKILQGEVHDDNAWSMGGVAPHAGLFGRIDDVSQWGLLLRKAFLLQKNTSVFKTDVTEQFLKRSISTTTGDWAIGFMLPTKGKASCGNRFSSQSVGHTGFTGTSFWFDPKKDLIVTLLTNRVYPTRENINIRKFRPWIHNKVCEVIDV